MSDLVNLLRQVAYGIKPGDVMRRALFDAANTIERMPRRKEDTMKINRTVTFDPKCHELADAFLEDEAGINNKADVNDLAGEIQNTIENWIDRARANCEPRETGDAWDGGFADNH